MTASAIRFRFELRPLDEVSPWGGDRPGLHWFGLTEGWYWLEAGDHELLRRSRDDSPMPYVDYYAARLWEDVLTMTPAVLEPVPADLRPFVASDPRVWLTDASGADEDDEEDGAGLAAAGTADDPVLTAALWHDGHRLDLGYLRNPPHLAFWRTVDGERDEICVDWRHEDNGEIGFTAPPELRLNIPTAQYVAAVRALDRDLMTAMRHRIDELERRGGLPGVDLDLAWVRRDHRERAQRLSTRGGTDATDTDWDAVRAGARLLLGDDTRGS